MLRELAESEKIPMAIGGGGIGGLTGVALVGVLDNGVYEYYDRIAAIAKQNNHLRLGMQVAAENHINPSSLRITNHQIAQNTQEIHHLQAHDPNTLLTSDAVGFGVIAVAAVAGAAVFTRLFSK